jgi:2-oxoisovalerate dehydrogenase E1 component alpha subunit
MGKASVMTKARADIPAELTPDRLLEIYYKMLLSRRLDERMWVLHRQGKIAFHISGLGQEGAQVGAAYTLKPGFDFVHPYYRDMALSISLGITPRELMLAVYGKKGEPSSGARQMPAHYGSRRLNIVPGSSPVATQVPQAAGIAFGELYKRKVGLVAPDAELPVTLTCLGEGATSQGDFHEALTWAGVYKLPLIVMVENNLYAISVPITKQSAVTDVSDRACAYGVVGVSTDGNDFLATYKAVKKAVERARSGEGATLLEAKTYRPVPHSSDDDDRSYRTREEVEEWKKKDPILRARALLMEEDILSEKLNQEYEDRVMAEVDDANKFAEEQPYPETEWGMGPVYA